MDIYHIWCNLKPGVTDIKFALYRDFPDAVRETGEEKF